ncbi:MAG: SDR family NAD(P)-dependent oxidoreductase, partial [Myxococcota bacterium]
SGGTGAWANPGDLTDPEHWIAHLRAPVRFDRCLETLRDLEGAHLVEVGPGAVLTGLAGASLPVTATLPPELPQDVALLAAVGRLWQHGAAPTWDRLVPSGNRLELPPSPLALERCWIDAPAGPAPTALAAGEVYVPSWRRALPSKPVAGGCWLVVTAGGPLGAAVVRRLRASGARVTVAEAGERFERIDRGLYRVRPGSEADFGALLAELRNGALTPSRVLHLYNAEALPRVSDDVPALLDPLALGRALVRQGRSATVALTFVAQGIHDVHGDEPLVPSRALLAGARVLPQEHRELACRLVDVALVEDPGLDELAAAVIAEAAHPGDGPEVALRGRARWVRHYDPVQLPPPGPGAGGVLIAGGGELGWTLARALVARGHRTLVVLSRSGGSGPAGLAAELEAAGVVLHPVRGDVTQRADLERALALAAADPRGLAGVVHTAGVPGTGPIDALTDASARAVLAPKRAARHLVDLLAGRSAFLVLCSSTAAHLGSIGQADYVAANAALDALAREARTHGIPALSIAWDTWGTIGMAARAVVPAALRGWHRQRLAEGLTPESAADLFLRALDALAPLAGGAAEVVVSAVPFAERQRQARPAALAAEIARARVDEPRGASFVAPDGPVAEVVAEVFAEVLGSARVGATDDFFELGGHSLLAAQAVGRLRERFDVDLPIRVLFERRRVDAVAASIEDLLLEAPEVLL